MKTALRSSTFQRLLLLLTLSAFLVGESPAASLPGGFTETEVGSNWNSPVGVTFGKNSAGNKERAYVWDRWGRVWIVEDGVKLLTPMLDIAEEVADYADYGMLGFALDPDFQQNGFIYCLYVVDRHHLIYFGTPNYNPTANLRSQATIGRVTRYTCARSDDFRSVDPASRKILLGESITTGFPILHTSHGVGSLVFGTDGTLMVSCGDGASFTAVDYGGTTGGAYGPQGMADGIISAAENVGAFRCQMLDSLSGKMLRIDPATGDGIASNPYFQAGSPRSARSRIWSVGLRNPSRFSLQPGSGTHDPAAANPGTFYIGDVGWKSYEELSVATGPGQNFGWPLYEGFSQQAEYWPRRPSGMNAADQKQPAVDWVHGGTGARALYNGTVYKVGTSGSPVTGTNFGGNAACGGTWYSGTDYPPEWRDLYFQADFSGQWVRALRVDAQHQLTNARSFASGEAFIFLTTHPVTGGIYYCSVENGASKGTVRRINYAPGGNRPPVSVASVDRQYGASPLTVQFSSALSSDPENSALSYVWNFGDGTTSTSANPLKTFTVSGQKRYDVLLTVTDAGGATASSAVVITVNNTPPVVQITSPAPGAQYPLNQGQITYNLTANVTDTEHLTSTLTHQWTVTLVHDNHEHIDLAVNASTTAATFSPLGNDPDSTYYYRITLRVTDPLGLTTVIERLFMPQTGSAAIVINPDFFSITSGGGKMLDVLANDHGAVTDADFATLQIVTPPASGTAVPDPVTGRIRYLHNAASATTADSFTYRLSTKAGTLSAIGTASIAITPAAINNAPVALSDNAIAGRGQSASINVLTNDTDPGGTIVPGSLVILTRPVSGTVSVNGITGAVTYAHNNSTIAADTFTYSVADAAGLRSEPATVSITISSANGSPVISNPGSQTSVRGNAISLQLTASDPNGQPLAWSATGLPAGLTLNSSGLITGTVAPTAASATVTVTVSDGSLSASTSFAWNISAPPTGNGLLGEYFTGITPGLNPPVLTRNDATIFFDWGIGGPSAATGIDTFSVRWTGDIVALYTESYTFTLPVDDGARVWIDNVLVLDKWLPIGVGGTFTFTVNLTAGRHTPFKLEYYEQWGGAGLALAWQSTRQTLEYVPASAFLPAGGISDTTPPTAIISGPAGPVAGPFAMSVVFSENISGLTLSDFAITNGSASILDTTGGAFTLTVNPAASGNVSVSLPAASCQDGSGNGNTASNTFTVSYIPPANRPPAVSPIGNQYTLRAAIVSLQVQASDPDGDPLTYSATGLPSGLTMNVSTGLIAGTISLSAAASSNVTVTARDPGGQTASKSFTWATALQSNTGIRGEYYTGVSPGGTSPVMSRIDPAVNFDWADGSPGGNVSVDGFSVRWTADLVPAFTEAYTFTIAGDNGYRLWINNVLVIENWTPWDTGGWRSATVNLTAGQRTPLRLEYFESGGAAAISFYWNSARQPWEVVPASKLIPPNNPPASAGTLLPAISTNFAISNDPAGGTILGFTRPITTGTALTMIEASHDLLTWETIDTQATVTRNFPGLEEIRIQVIPPSHVHADGSVHQHGIAEPVKFFRVKLVE